MSSLARLTTGVKGKGGGKIKKKASSKSEQIKN